MNLDEIFNNSFEKKMLDENIVMTKVNECRDLIIQKFGDIKFLEEQAREFKPRYVCLYDIGAASDMRIRLADTDIKVLSGIEGLCELASLSCDMVINSVVGMVGLRPTLAAIEAGNRIGLANKETMVVGGDLVTAAAKRKSVDIIPIDSEHSAIFQSLMGNECNKIEKIIYQ